jgi:hypothetical protein
MVRVAEYVITTLSSPAGNSSRNLPASSHNQTSNTRLIRLVHQQDCGAMTAAMTPRSRAPQHFLIPDRLARSSFRRPSSCDVLQVVLSHMPPDIVRARMKLCMTSKPPAIRHYPILVLVRRAVRRLIFETPNLDTAGMQPGDRRGSHAKCHCTLKHE